MIEPKAFASLSSTLLARKGQAKPAMRPQAFLPPADMMNASHQAHDDLGWNDMGQEIPSPSEPVALHGDPVPVIADAPAVVEQQAQLLREFAPAPAPELVAPTPFVEVETFKPLIRAAAGSKSKAAFTLRLDAARHLRLRLVSAVMHRSAQQVVTQALDEFLARQPSNDELASYTTR